MTERESKIYQFICAYHADNGFSPSYTEIGDAIGIKSRGNIFSNVMALLDRGLLRREGRSGASRALIPVVMNDYERGRADGYRAAIKEFGLNLTRAA